MMGVTIQSMVENVSMTSPDHHYTANDTSNYTTESLTQESHGCDNPNFKHACLYLLAVVGIAGNIFSFVVLHLKYPETIANFLLKALAIADSAFLFTALSASVLENFVPAEGPLACVIIRFTIQYIVSDITQFISVWTIVALSFSRFIAVAKPFHTTHYFTNSMMWRTLLVIVATGLLLEGTRMSLVAKCEEKIVQNETVYHCIINNHKPWIRYIDFAYFAGVLFLLPAIPLVVFNIGLTRAVATLKEERTTNMPTLTKEFREITKTVIVIVTVFMITYLPYLVYGVIIIVPSFLKYVMTNRCAATVIYDALVVGSHINSSVNFIIYLFCKSSFRAKSKALILKKNMLRRSSSTSSTRNTKYTLVTRPNSDPSRFLCPSPTYNLEKF